MHLWISDEPRAALALRGEDHQYNATVIGRVQREAEMLVELLNHSFDSPQTFFRDGISHANAKTGQQEVACTFRDTFRSDCIKPSSALEQRFCLVHVIHVYHELNFLQFKQRLLQSLLL